MTIIRQLTRVAVTAAATLSGGYVFYHNTTKKPVLASGGNDSSASRLYFQPFGPKWDSNWDMREGGKKRRKSKDGLAGLDSINSSEEKELRPTGTRHLIFIRHGQYNEQSDKDEGRTLTEMGRTQAEMTGQRLKDLGFQYTVLVNSTMTRAVETADIISKYLSDVPREECCMLREGAPIVPEPASAKWRPEEVQFYQDNARIEAAFRKHVHRADVEQVGDSVEVFVCHANVIRYFVCRALQFPPEGWLRMSINNCGITWLTVRPNGRVSLRSLGDTGHLNPGSIS